MAGPPIAAPSATTTPRPRRRHVVTANEVVSDHIRRSIFEGVLKPGDRVPQDEIGEELGLSRHPVREALINLKHQGFVTIHPHRGAYVSAFDAEVVTDHFDLSGNVLAYATRLATERADDSQLAHIRALTTELAAETDPEPVNTLANELTRAITLASGSSRARLVIATISRVVPGNFFAVIPGGITSIHRVAPKLARAMGRRDAEAAGALIDKYIRSNGQLVVDYLRSTGVFT